jgi:hypothetical protein
VQIEICVQKPKMFPELSYISFLTVCFAIYECVIQCASMGFSSKGQILYFVKPIFVYFTPTRVLKF